MLIASTIGNLLAGFVSEKFGRKSTIFGSNILLQSSWTITYFAPNFLVLLAGRVIMGLACGLSIATSFILLGEISTVSYRGTLATINSMCLNCGYMFGLIISASLDLAFYVPCKYYLLSYAITPYLTLSSCL